MPELSEEQHKLLAAKQELYDAYYNVFKIARDSDHAIAQRRVLEDMQYRAFFTLSMMPMTPDALLLSYREGQRSFMLEILKFIEKGRSAPKAPVIQAHSNTARS